MQDSRTTAQFFPLPVVVDPIGGCVCWGAVIVFEFWSLEIPTKQETCHCQVESYYCKCLLHSTTKRQCLKSMQTNQPDEPTVLLRLRTWLLEGLCPKLTSSKVSSYDDIRWHMTYDSYLLVVCRRLWIDILYILILFNEKNQLDIGCLFLIWSSQFSNLSV